MKNFSVTSISSKGQIVIPNEIRKQLGLSVGTKFIVLTDGSTLLLKPIEEPKMETFKNLIKESRKLGKELGLKKADVKEAIEKVRNENRS